MKIFIDTANLKDIEEALERGFISGITTNPSLLAKEPKSDFEEHIRKIAELITKYEIRRHLSVEVFSRDPQEILKQAHRFTKLLESKFVDLSVKVQVGWDELGVIRKLVNADDISVNCTACMSVTQAMMAARAGACYVSFFWGRIRDSGVGDKFKEQRERVLSEEVFDRDDFNPAIVISRTRTLLERARLTTEIIAGSMRSILDIRNAALAGAHIVTVPPKFFKDMISHFKTDEVIDEFLVKFQNWLKQSPD